jgi:hypothetical protein
MDNNYQTCLTSVNHCQPWSTIVNHDHGQPRSTIVMFVTLRQYGYVRHILCSSYKAKLVTLRQYGYVNHIVMAGLCLSHCEDKIFASHYVYWIFSSHCDDRAMFITLQ